MLFHEAVDMADAFVFKDFVDGNEYSRLLNFAETAVDGRTEELHCGAETHVSVDQWGNVIAQTAYLTIKNSIVFLKVVLTENG